MNTVPKMQPKREGKHKNNMQRLEQAKTQAKNKKLHPTINSTNGPRPTNLQKTKRKRTTDTWIGIISTQPHEQKKGKERS
jgi:hypothetical protein